MEDNQNPFEGLTPVDTLPTEVNEDPFAGLTKVETQQTDAFAGLTKEDSSPKYQELKKEMDVYGPLDLVTSEAAAARGGRVLTKVTTEDDIKTLAGEHGVNPDELRSLAPYWMALPENMSAADVAKRIAGGIGYGIFGDIPQWLYKKTQDANMRAALDDLKELSEGRMGAAEFVGWNLLPVGKLGKAITVPEKVLPTLAKGAAVGAAFGVAGSREGEELQQAGLGAITGGALGLTGLGFKRMISKVETGDLTPKGITPKEDVTINVDKGSATVSLEYVKNNESKLAEIADDAWSRIKDSETNIADAAIKKKALTDDEVERIINEQLSPDSVQVVKGAMAKAADKEIGEISDKAVVDKLVADRREAFARELASDYKEYGEKVKEGGVYRSPTTDEILARASGMGDERMYDSFLEYAYRNTAVQQIDKLKIRNTPDNAPVGKIIVNGLSDRQFGLKTIDEMQGSSTLIPYYQLNTNYNLFTGEKSLIEKSLSNSYKIAKRGDLVKDATNTGGGGGNLFQKMDRGLDNELSPDEQAVAASLRKIMDDVSDRANTMEGTGITPLKIQKREDFGLPNVMVDQVDYVIKMRQAKDIASAELQEKMGKTFDEIVSGEDYAKAMEVSPSFRDVNAGIRLSTDTPITDGASLRFAFKEATEKGASNPRLYSVAFTTLKREEKIPDFLREKNVFKIVKKYSENTLRSVYLREPLEKLITQSKLLKAAGNKAEAEYVERLVADNLGIRANSMARLGNSIRIKFAEVVDKSLSTIITNPEQRKNVVDSIRLMPELMANIQYNIYPNVLGMNPRAHLSQLLQTWAKNAPEIGGTYGYSLTGKSFLHAVFALRSAGSRELYRKVEEYGLEPKSFIREASESVADSMERYILFNTGAKAIRKAADIFMYTYGKMDTFNRGVTLYMAEKLTEDLNNGVRGALDAVSKMPISVRRELVKRKGNLKEQASLLAQHLNSTTQYNYNRPSMSELGVILGPLFSTFTKWPLATAGDIIADLRTKGIVGGGLRTVEKYGVTLLLASMMDNAIRYSLSGELDVGGDYKDYDDTVKKIVGTGGFTTMAPGYSVTALFPGPREKSFFTPPVVDAFYSGILTPMMTGDTDKMLEQGGRVMKTFIPGAFVYRFTTEDIPFYMTGEIPR